jgi:omega-amidase
LLTAFRFLIFFQDITDRPQDPGKISINLVLFFRGATRMKIALIQMNMDWENTRANLVKAEKFFRKAAGETCDVLVFPEMFNTGFSMNIKSVAEPKKGATFMLLSRLAKQYRINVIAGYAVKPAGRKKADNKALVIDRNGSVLAEYTKIHPFSFAGEDQFFNAGKTPATFRIDGVPGSIFICYDLRFPEKFRTVAREVFLIFVIANWPASRKDHWETLLKARAIENQCFIIGVNRTGKDGNGIIYPGASHVFDPLGNDICSGDAKEQFITCEIDPGVTTEVRSRFPFLADMRF